MGVSIRVAAVQYYIQTSTKLCKQCYPLNLPLAVVRIVAAAPAVCVVESSLETEIM